ncbi:MAG: putative metalloprotease with PDZ domain, partial [Pseudohongiellaceae bacterium]
MGCYGRPPMTDHARTKPKSPLGTPLATTLLTLVVTMILGALSPLAPALHGATPSNPPIAPAQKQTETMIRYHVTFPELLAHRVHVTMFLEGLNGDSVDIAMPVWSPGSYLVREYARNVLDLSATASTGESLVAQKISKNTWRIESNGTTSVQVDYSLYANELSVRTNEVNAQHAFLQSPATFFRHGDSAAGPHQVTIDTPTGWDVFTSLSHSADGWTAANYDELADSPFELGAHEKLTFELNGVPHHIVLAGESDLDAEQLRDDVATVCEEVASIFGQMPFEDYTFIFLLVDSGGGGLEHKNSSVCMSSRWDLVKKKKYQGFLGLVAHEYFHAWNVKRFRPEALGPFDYDTENYTSDLWVAEGITSYLDDLSTARVRFIDKIEDYLSDRASAFRTEADRPGSERTSLAASSFDAWIKLYRPDENSTNSTVSYYSKGALVAFMLDLRILRFTKGERGLADVLRLGWERYTTTDVGFPAGALLALASEVAGSDLSEFFADYVDGTVPLSPNDDLAWLGLALTVIPEETERRLPEDDKGFALEPWLGITTRTNDGLVRVDTVLEGGPAFTAGLNHDDLLLAVDQMRVSPSTLNDRLDRTAGAEIALTLWRGQELLVMHVTPELRRLSKWKLSPLENVSDEQLAAFSNWCG